MAKKKKQAVDLTPEQQQEADYQKAVRRMEGAGKMLQAEDRIQMYKTAMSMFEALGGYKDSEAHKKNCKKGITRSRKEYREEAYQEGIKRKSGAKSSSDYEEAIEAFQRVKREYRDIPRQIAECKQLRDKEWKNERNKNVLKKTAVLMILAAAAAFILYLRTPDAYYKEGRLLMGMRDYERASTVFAHSRGYKDTEKYLLECNYQRALRFAGEGSYGTAVKILRSRVGDYKDALEKKLEFELDILAESGVGRTVTFGDGKWILADKADQKALLVLKKPMKGETVYRASGKAASWETSDLRDWLNQEFYQDCFSVYEREAVVQTEVAAGTNSVYGTDGGNATRDYVFCLDEQEAEQYKEILTVSGSQKTWWLRTPGKAADSAAFVSADGTVMRYGYTADSADVAVRPALWVKLR